MPILLDHVIVPSHDRDAGAKFLANLLGVPWEEATDYFAPVYVNDSLTLDFENSDAFDSHHYCFKVSEEDFDEIFGRIKAAGVPFRSQPGGPNDMALNTRLGGKNLYWEGADGHIWEILTVSYARPIP